MSVRRTICCLLLVGAIFSPAVVTADAGDGLSAGNLVVHPGLTVGASFNSNLFRASASEQTRTLAAPSVRFVPSLSISSVNPDMVDFRVDARVGWEQYISTGERVVADQSGLTADVGADLTFNKAGAVSFAIGDRLQRTNEPPATPSAQTYNRLVNRAGATLGVHPGGRVFQHFLSYDWIITRYDQFAGLNKQAHDFTLKNYWRFLPRTAAMLAADFQVIQYAEPTRNGGLENVNSTPLRLTAGLSGLITPRLSLRLHGGWGFGLYQSGEDFSSVLLDTQLAYAFGTLAHNNKLFLGYERNFQDSTIANFATYHRPYTGYHHAFANRRLNLRIEVDALLRDYVGAPSGSFPGASGTVTINDGLNDALIGATGALSVAVKKWWDLGLTYRFQANLTDDVVTVDGDEFVREYQQHILSLTTTFRY